MNAEIRLVTTAAESQLAELFARAQHGLPGGRRTAAIRTAAFDRFRTQGLPNSRIEAWKYTDLRRLLQDAKPLAPEPSAAAKARAAGEVRLFAGLGFRRILIVDGRYVPEFSDVADLETGVTIRPTEEVLGADEPILAAGGGADSDPVAALNGAFAAGGVVIAIAPDVVLARPIHLAFVTTDGAVSATFTRSRLDLGRGARATLIETYEGPDQSDYQVNTAFQLSVAEGAQLDHIRVAGEGASALHLGTLVAEVADAATLQEFGFSLGGAIVRNQMFVRIAGSGAIVGVHEGSLLAGRQHADTTLSIDHAAAGSQSREVFKAVVDDEARAVFQGRITVQPGAQQTDARMMARALLLSDEAVANCKPELEIFADDVQCGHGTTTGALDDQLKFYLMARGIPAKEAEALLIRAFVGEVIEAIPREDVREALTQAMAIWLDQRG